MTDAELFARLQTILAAFERGAELWSKLAEDADLNARLPGEHVAALPEAYLDLRYHAHALAHPTESLPPPVKPHKPGCSCGWVLPMPRWSAQPRVADDDSIVHLRCPTCTKLWTLRGGPPPVWVEKGAEAPSTAPPKSPWWKFRWLF